MKKNILIAVLAFVIVLLVVFLLWDKRIVIQPEASLSQTAKSEPSATESITQTTEIPVVKEDEKATEPLVTETPDPTGTPSVNQKVIVIDAGHQKKGNSQQEPIAPGASQTKPKVSSGTQGVSSGVPEYVVTLEVAKKLKAELSKRGYHVIMVREENDVNISNSERAQIANEANADAFIRLHCNGAENSGAQGALTMCQTKNNPYCGQLYVPSRRLSECVLNGLCQTTGAKKQGVSETDTMSGINWCQVPVTIVEMGFMTNPQEDLLLNDDAYQNKLANGIANGIDQFFR